MTSKTAQDWLNWISSAFDLTQYRDMEIKVATNLMDRDGFKGWHLSSESMLPTAEFENGEKWVMVKKADNGYHVGIVKKEDWVPRHSLKTAQWLEFRSYEDFNNSEYCQSEEYRKDLAEYNRIMQRYA